MKSSYSSSFKGYLEAVFAKCLTITGHSEYHVNYFYIDEPRDSDKEDEVTALSVGINSSYLFMNVRVYPFIFEQFKQGKLLLVADHVLHECCHLFEEPLRVWYEDRIAGSENDLFTRDLERQVQRTKNCIMRLLPEDWYKV